MAILKHLRKTNFVSIPNSLAQSAQQGLISYEALGVLVDMLSRPENWTVYKSFYKNEKCGQIVVNRIFKELKDAGFLFLSDIRKDGKIIDRVWIVSDEKMSENENISKSIEMLAKSVDYPDAGKSIESCMKTENISKPTENHGKSVENLTYGKPHVEETSIIGNQHLQIKNNINKITNTKKENTFMLSCESNVDDEQINTSSFEEKEKILRARMDSLAKKYFKGDFIEKPINVNNLEALSFGAYKVLEYLNRTQNKKFRFVATNLDLIKARLKTGVPIVKCYDVIDKKGEKWGKDEKMNEFLRPATLFSAKNFEQYLSEVDNG